MKVIVKSIFYKTNLPIDLSFNEYLNFVYWILIMGFNVIKWIFPFIVFDNLNQDVKYVYLSVISFSALFKICAIGIPIMIKIKRYFNKCIIVLFAFIIICECMFEVPIQKFFPDNHVYVHSTYFRIYDKQTKKYFQIFIKIFEYLLIDIIIIWIYSQREISIEVIIFSFFILLISTLFLVFFLICAIYFLCIYNKEDEIKVVEPKKAKKEKLDILNVSEIEIDKNSPKEVNKKIESDIDSFKDNILNTSSRSFNRISSNPENGSNDDLRPMTIHEQKMYVEEGRKQYIDGVKKGIRVENSLLD